MTNYYILYYTECGNAAGVSDCTKLWENMVVRKLERRSDPAKNHTFAFFLVDILRSWLQCAFLKVSRSSDTIHIYD
ncbi:hypothetical protein K0M31_008168 [Melipona bicolor]|uniref:Uncharacterized protein n=1 Tax=Melipona bicolor TaxID=60889 RepID=A0AA40KK64_9HYME|nr:hypothetical protein K0M31_008168 [Melipona bicolor]